MPSSYQSAGILVKLENPSTIIGNKSNEEPLFISSLNQGDLNSCSLGELRLHPGVLLDR